jgi:hypothetical protein
LIRKSREMPPGENAISMCPIRAATSCRLPGRYDDSEKVTCAKASLPQRRYSSGGGSRGAAEVWIYGIECGEESRKWLWKVLDRFGSDMERINESRRAS